MRVEVGDENSDEDEGCGGGSQHPPKKPGYLHSVVEEVDVGVCLVDEEEDVGRGS